MIMKWNMSLLSCLGWHTQVVYFTGEKSNLQSYANALNYILSCRNLALLKPFDGLCLGHALSKGELITMDEKIFVGQPCASMGESMK